MAQLTFAMNQDELVADVLVNLEVGVLLTARASGQACPAIGGRGLVDTGSNVSGVSSAILHQLGVRPEAQSSTTSLSGSVQVNLYRVSLHDFDRANPSLKWLSVPSLLVMNLVPGFPHDVLIGMDVLLGCKTLVDGPARQFTFHF